MQGIIRNTCRPHRTICYSMTNLFAHDPDCDFWFDHYEQECTCGRSGWKPPATDSVQELRAVWDEIVEPKRWVAELEARVAFWFR